MVADKLPARATNLKTTFSDRGVALSNIRLSGAPVAHLYLKAGIDQNWLAGVLNRNGVSNKSIPSHFKGYDDVFRRANDLAQLLMGRYLNEELLTKVSNEGFVLFGRDAKRVQIAVASDEAVKPLVSLCQASNVFVG